MHDASANPRPVNISQGKGSLYAWASNPLNSTPGDVYVALFNANDPLEALTSYYSANTLSHYLSAGCQGCSSQEEYAPIRTEGHAFASPCQDPTLGCIPLVTYYSKTGGNNLVVPAGWGPIPNGFQPWSGNVAYVLPLNYSGTAPTVVLELWSGQAAPGGPVDYWSLGSLESRAEAIAKNYTQMGGGLARLLTSNAPINGTLVGVDLLDLGLPSNVTVCGRSLWAKEDLPGTFNLSTGFSVSLPPHEGGLFILSPKLCPWRGGGERW